MSRGILLVTPGFADGEGDTACIPALQIYARALRAALPEVPLTVLALMYPHRSDPFEWHGLRVVPLGAKGGTALWRRAWTALRQIGPVDVVHSFWLGHAALIAQAWARRCRARHVATMMGQEVRTRSWALRCLRPGRAHLVTLSAVQDAVMRQVSGRGGDSQIPWGTAPLAPSAKRDVDVVANGWLTEIKDPMRCVDVLARVSAARPDLTACWIGGGPEEPRLAQAARAKGLSLRITGTVTREAALAQMARGRVLLHTAPYEGFGLVIAEAAELGLAVVSGPVGIAPETAGVRIAATQADMAEAVLAALAAPLPPPSRPWPIEESLEAYRDLYQI